MISNEAVEGLKGSYNVSQWSKPPLQAIKINSDAAIKDGVCMVGIMARDHAGAVIQIKAVKFDFDNQNLDEAFWVLQALLLAKEEGWDRVWCESDARNVINWPKRS